MGWRALCGLLCWPAVASAYTVGSVLTKECHEPLAVEALRAVRAAGEAPPIPPTADEQALIDDLPYALDADARDLAGAALTLGVRDNDLHGRDPEDQADLVPVTGAPERQVEHCLRAPSQDEPTGTAAALADCRAFIHAHVAEALDGLGSDGRPDPARRVSLPVYLGIRGRIDASLPLFYVRMGQALHALQDGFSHTMRTADGLGVVTVLNWTEYVDESLVESRDGPPHMRALDNCAGTDPLRRQRRLLAATASTEVMQAALDPARDRASRLAAVDALLAQYLTPAPDGCTAANSWCDAPENAFRDGASCECALGGRRSPSPIALAVAALILARLLRRRRRRWRLRGPRRSPFPFPFPLPSALAIALASSLVPSAARADEAPQVVRPPPRFGAYAAVSGAFDHTAFAGAVAGRFRINDHWLVGLDVEWNPWLSLANEEVHAGALNLYATLVHRWPLLGERVNLRTSLHVGASVLLFDLFGAPAGSVGPYFGLGPLGIDVWMGRGFRLVVDPLEISLPVPHLTGVPFFYQQYRFTIGLQFGA